MKHCWRTVLCAVIVLLLAGCGAAQGVNRETLQAEATAFIDESTQIASAGQALATAAVATSAAARTQIMQIDGLNQQLALTMRAVLPPTQQIVNSAGAVTPGMNAPLPGQFTPTANPDSPASTGDSNQLTEVGVALAVREADGCAAGLNQNVASTAPRLYATTRILNALAGTQIGAAWSADGQVVYSNSAYTIPQDDTDFCLWFYIEPTDITFSPGNWSIQFLVNGALTGQAASFTISS